jgi:chemotaxis protein CheD
VLIKRLLKLGARRENLEAKVFGGGNVVRALSSSTVGERNASFVIGFLATENIPILAKDLIDVYPRKVYHFPQTGKVMVRKLRAMHDYALFEREREYVSKIRQTYEGGAIELFD